MEDWKRRVLKEVRVEVASANPLIQDNVIYVEFVSRSNGRNRPKRKKLREVRLVTWRGKTQSIGNRMTKKLEFLMKDVFPEELVKNSCNDWIEAFLEALRDAEKLKVKGK